MASSDGTGGKAGSMTWLLGGIVLGVLGTVFLPGLAEPYLPDALRSERQEVTGTVEAKSAEVDRLLLTVGSDAGAMLITYTKNVAEIDLLVDVGDTVVLEVEEYAPFVDNAKIRRVAKRADASPSAAESVEAAFADDAVPEEPPATGEGDSTPDDGTPTELEAADQ